jgi:hypothetical protein
MRQQHIKVAHNRQVMLASTSFPVYVGTCGLIPVAFDVNPVLFESMIVGTFTIFPFLAFCSYRYTKRRMEDK